MRKVAVLFCLGTFLFVTPRAIAPCSKKIDLNRIVAEKIAMLERVLPVLTELSKEYLRNTTMKISGSKILATSTWCMPHQKDRTCTIYIENDLMLALDDDELIAILSHELGHIALNPWPRRGISRNVQSFTELGREESDADRFGIRLLECYNAHPEALLGAIRKINLKTADYNRRKQVAEASIEDVREGR